MKRLVQEVYRIAQFWSSHSSLVLHIFQSVNPSDELHTVETDSLHATEPDKPRYVRLPTSRYLAFVKTKIRLANFEQANREPISTVILVKGKSHRTSGQDPSLVHLRLLWQCHFLCLPGFVFCPVLVRQFPVNLRVQTDVSRCSSPC